MLSNLDEMNMQTDGDADRARALGADPAHVHVIGNSKFDQANADLPSAEQVAADMRLPVHAPTLVAGSTHAGEDEAVLDAFLQVRQSVPGSRLIIAPRRLERVPELRDALSQRKLSARFRSEEKTDDRPIADSVDCPVFVLDTIGELRKAYGLARLAYVGGSLVPVGGHDILQPLAQGKPVLFGPHTQNCREIAVTAIEKGAARRIHNADELAAEWIRILQDENAARIMSQAGLDLIEKNRGAARKYAERIASYIEG
jgi:3-deoxy-D-manno-octulosonic-acid transferase